LAAVFLETCVYVDGKNGPKKGLKEPLDTLWGGRIQWAKTLPPLSYFSLFPFFNLIKQFLDRMNSPDGALCVIYLALFE